MDVAGKFYCTTPDWTAEPMDMGRAGMSTIFRAGSTQIGGMMATPAQMKDVPPHWLTYFGVTHCDGTVKKVRELDGKVLGPPTDISNVGRFAVRRDGPGAAFAVFKPQNP